jgi:hypothetical protein
MSPINATDENDDHTNAAQHISNFTNTLRTEGVNTITAAPIISGNRQYPSIHWVWKKVLI